MADPRTPTERLADRPLTGAVSIHDGECDLCGRPADHGPICSGCFDEVWSFNTDAEAEEHARVMRLTLRQECIRCGERIEDGLARLGSTECVNCKRQPHNAAA